MASTERGDDDEQPQDTGEETAQDIGEVVVAQVDATDADRQRQNQGDRDCDDTCRASANLPDQEREGEERTIEFIEWPLGKL